MKLDLFKHLNKKKRKKTKKKTPKAIFLILLVLLLIFVGIKVITGSLSNISYFNVEKIIMTDSSLTTDEIARYCNIKLPVNIFRINLGQVASNIKMLHPELKKVIVSRKLPDTLIINTYRRQPVAEINIDDKYYRIDAEGFILPDGYSSSNAELVDIAGVRDFLILGSILKVSESKRLHDALDILEILKDNEILKDYCISQIDVSNYRNPTFTINDRVQVKLKKEELEEKIKVLGENLPSIKLDEVEYIDLRFKDVIIGTE